MPCSRSSLLLLVAIASTPACARTIQADPSNYRTRVAALKAGDVLEFAPGDYPGGLRIEGLAGTADRWITLRGPGGTAPARFLGDPGQGRNTIEIVDSSFVAIERLTIDGRGIEGIHGVSAKDGEANRTHHVRIEGCTIVGHGATQQTVGISTKCPTWGWVIRGNRVVGAGTGLYLGDSDGTSPFVGGLIEGNLVEDPVGYCMQVKHQLERPRSVGLPTRPTSTVVRNNVFVKSDRESPDGDRPNVLLGTFPPSGPGAEDRYEVYGNFFLHNPRENLLQCAGRVSIHDNLFVDGGAAAIYLTDHNGPLDLAVVYHNTIHATATGISFGSRPTKGGVVAGNLVFSAEPFAGEFEISSEANLGAPVGDAPQHVAKPGTEPGAVDFHPRPGKCAGRALARKPFQEDLDFDRYFDGRPTGDLRRRGAYATEETEGAWAPAADFKTGGPTGERR